MFTPRLQTFSGIKSCTDTTLRPPQTAFFFLVLNEIKTSTSAGCQTEMGTYVTTKPSNHGVSRDLLHCRQTIEPLEFSKTSKNPHLKWQIFCFCGMTVVSSTVFEKEISCQHVDVKMRMLPFFSVQKSGVISRWGQSVSDRDFSHLSLLYV